MPEGGMAKHKMTAVSLMGAIMALTLTACGGGGGGGEVPVASNTTTPIKHLIVVIGENRSFDNVFATYMPRDPAQHVWNLLSQGVIDSAGNRGPKFSLAMQQQATDTSKFELNPTQTGPFATLPQPNTTLSALPAPICVLSTVIFKTPLCADIGLDAAQQKLLDTGGTGQPLYQPSLGLLPVPDCRYPSTLPNGPYSLVGASRLNGCGAPLLIPAIVPTQYDGHTGDPVHRFFQMWQQNDCSAASISAANPTGCTKDLYTWVATTVGWQITADGNMPTDNEGTFQGGIAMGYYNMAKGDYPFFASLAQSFAINDNYHQFMMGGSGGNSESLMTADVFFYTDSNGNPVKPTFPNLIENPDPQPGSNNFYIQSHPDPGDLGSTSDGGLVNCSDPTAPGVKAIRDYLAALPYKPFKGSNCDPGVFYQVDNEYPSFDTQGNPNVKSNAFPNGPDFAIGPQTIPTIGDALSAHGISWKYYGEGLSVANQNPPLNQGYCAICNGFQYSRSIMTSALKNNLIDLVSLYSDLASGNLPAVSFVKPDTLVDSHPGTSTAPLFEAFCQKIINTAKANAELWRTTAILITFDEGGGWYDSGFIQPIDFFGDGPRTVMIAVSPFAKHGFVDHEYSDHASILKFIEENWRLGPLSARSRDNLPNPVVKPAQPYFPTNSPAIGDLMNMFDFTR